MKNNIIKKLSIKLLFIATFITAIAGCTLFQPIPNTFNIAINAGSKVNPDEEGRSSPVVLRIYELSADKKFSSLDFFDLYDDDKAALEKTLVNKQEMELNPNESRKVDFILNPKTKYIGFLVAYRDIDTAKWREIISVESRQPSGIPVYSLQGLTVNLEKNKINIEIKD